jgi:hypothetical protein
VVARFTETFDGGADLAAFTTGGVWTVSGSLTYTTVNKIHGTSALQTPNTNASNYAHLQLGANPTVHSTQGYWRCVSTTMTGLNETSLVRLAQAGTTTAIVQLKLLGNGKIGLGAGGAAATVFSTGAVTVGDPFRVILQHDDSNAAANLVKALIFYVGNLNGTTPDETIQLPTFAAPATAFGRWMLTNVGTSSGTTLRQVVLDTFQIEDGVVTMLPYGTLSLGNAAETDAAQALALTKALGLGAAGGANIAQQLAYAKTLPLAAAGTTETAKALTFTKQLLLGVPTDLSTAPPLALLKALGLSVATGTDAARTVTSGKLLTLGRAQETGTAWPVEMGVPAVDYTPARAPIASTRAGDRTAATRSSSYTAVTRTVGASASTREG